MARGEIPPLLPPGDRHLHPPQAEGGHPTQDPEHPLPARHTPNHKGEQPHNTELHTLQPSRKTQRHSAPHTKAREASHSTPNQREHSFSVQAKGGQPGRSRSQANPEGQTATTPQHQLRKRVAERRRGTTRGEPSSLMQARPRYVAWCRSWWGTYRQKKSRKHSRPWWSGRPNTGVERWNWWGRTTWSP